MRGHIVANGIQHLAMPKIGCGLDRLAWDEVRDLILSTFKSTPLEIKVCMATPLMAMGRPAVEPPHEPAGSTALQDLYGSYDFYDDVSGAPLDHGLATAARRLEIDFFKSRGVYTKVSRESWMRQSG